MSTANILIALACLTFLSESTARDCDFIINGEIKHYRDQETFRMEESRCTTYKCNNGGYRIVNAQCDFEGTCRNHSDVFVATDCNTYSCTLPYGIENGYWKVDPVKTGCKDYHNVCRSPGEVFPYVVNGALENNCRCEQLRDRSYVYCTRQVGK